MEDGGDPSQIAIHADAVVRVVAELKRVAVSEGILQDRLCVGPREHPRPGGRIDECGIRSHHPVDRFRVLVGECTHELFERLASLFFGSMWLVAALSSSAAAIARPLSITTENREDSEQCQPDSKILQELSLFSLRPRAACPRRSRTCLSRSANSRSAPSAVGR